MAHWIDALASRSGPLQHAATLFTAGQGLEPDPPRGVDGLRELSRLIRSARAQPQNDDALRSFVEGAGAYLALLLLDHYRDAGHLRHGELHRLRLGACGTFDPFAALERAFSAEDVERALLAELSQAEQEAEGSGPTARVVAEARRALGELPGVRLGAHFEHTLWLELNGLPIELDLARIVEVTRGESDAVLRGAVHRLCASLEGDGARRSRLPWIQVQAKIFPRLVGPSFARALPGSAAELQLEPLGKEIWETFVLRSGNRARYVRRAEFLEWSETGGRPRAQALQNLAGTSDKARFLEHQTEHGRLVVAASRDGLDAARLLLPGLHTLLSARLGSTFVVAVPHRDALLACPCEPAPLVAELARRARAAARRAAHPISPRLWLLSGSGALHGADGRDA